jgi:medium-chain acyl-[acyl-carrier-protein] hydrolase
MRPATISPLSPTLPWIDTTAITPRTKLLLFCLPYAGGGSLAFRGWQSAAADVAICPIQLPGREHRYDHPPYRSLVQLIPDLAVVLQATLQQHPIPYALFGYSMGGLIAFELTRQLRSQGGRSPQALVVAAANPPHWQRASPCLHDLPDSKLAIELQKFNGTPAAVLQNSEFMALLLPLLRADFQLLETYQYQEQDPLPLPMLALGGEYDSTVTPAALAQWRQHAAQFEAQLFPGHHFFINTHQRDMLQSTLNFLAKLR